ncbi:hypothetical protein [Actinocorallia longicatena]|uniref:EthD domain-containing protein n=1 Tax=Actinocorallia longicatena TaxID=111803 RepID=A0ABP6Q572_9ACTN
MPRGVLVVRSAPADPARTAEFDAWYSEHLAEVLAIPGVLAARRYRTLDPEPSYLAVYDLEAEDLTAPIKALRSADAPSRARMPEVVRMDPPPEATLYELL